LRAFVPACLAIAAGAIASACTQSGPSGKTREAVGVASQRLSAGTPWFPVGPLGATPDLSPLFYSNNPTPDTPAPDSLNETGRGTAVVANPQNGRDVYLATAGGGLWEAPNLTLSTSASGTPSVNPWTLIFGSGVAASAVGGAVGPGAIGSIAIDPTSCSAQRCSTIWVGTGEAGIRRETFPGTGLYELNYETIGIEFPQSGYFATQIPGSSTIAGTAIGSIALYTPPAQTANRVYFTVTGANVSSGNEATVFAPPPSAGFGVFLFDDNTPQVALTREDVPPGDPPTQNLPGGLTLAMDSGGNGVLIAGIYNRGLYRKVLPSGTWCPLDPGAPAVAGCSTTPSPVLPNAETTRFDHIGLASLGATVYAAFSDCSNVWSANGAGVSSYTCNASLFVSTDAGATWSPGVQAPSCSDYSCLETYSNYDHGLAISPLTPHEFYFGGFFVHVSLDGHGQLFPAVLNNVHPDVHGVFPSPFTWSAASDGTLQPNTGNMHLSYVACDGGLALNLMDPNNPASNTTLAVAQPPVFSIDRLGVVPCATGAQCGTAVMAGTNDNGTVLYNGGRVWQTLTSADVGDTQFITANQGIVSWYDIQPSIIATTGFSRIDADPLAFGAGTTNDYLEYGKIFDIPLNGGPSSPDGHGKVMLPPLVHDRGSGNFYYGTDRVYQISGSALSTDPSTATLNPISPRLLEALGACTRGPDPDPQGTCTALHFCVDGQCRNYYTDIEKIDAISAIGSLNDQVYVGTYSGKFFKQVGGTGGAFVQVTIPTYHACDAATLGTTASLMGQALGPTPFDPNALANGNRCAPVTSIDVDPSSASSAYVTIGGFNNPGNHVFLYTNNGPGGSGDTWMPLFDGDLAANPDHDIPALAVRADPSSAGHVLLGTHTGLYERTASSQWAAVSTVPQVPVTDVVFDTALNRTYAATHGRGVYMTVTTPVVQVFAGWMDPSDCAPGTPCIWDLLVYGQGFQQPGLGNPPNCTVNILDENGNVCAGGTTDAFSGQPIRVLNGGTIGQTVFNESDGKQVIAACFNGNCVGSGGTVPITNCEPDASNPNRILSAVQVLCPNNNGVTVNVGKFCPQLQSPPATTWDPTLTGDPPPSSAPPITSVTLIAALDGMPMEALCSVTVPIYASDTHDHIVDRARAAFQTSTSCLQAGVKALPGPAPIPPRSVEVEDLASPDTLQIVAPNAVGRALYLSAITDPSSPGAPGLCENFQNFPGYATNQLDIIDTTFSTAPSGARGGSVTFIETSPLGRCGITVPTNPGDSASTIAQNILSAYQAAYPTDSNPACPYSSNPGDLVATSPFVPLAPGTLNSIASTRLEICLHDTGVGFSLGPNGIPLQDATLSQAALFATESLTIEERTEVKEPIAGFALVANEGGTSTTLERRVSVGAIVSVAPVVLGDKDTVTGRIKSAGTITLGNDDTIGGPVTSSTSVVLPDLSQYIVTFPTTFAPGLEVHPHTTETLAPGAYERTEVQSHGTLVLSTGTYYFTEFEVEHDATVRLDDTAGPVIVYVRDEAVLRGEVRSTGGGDPRLRFVYEGSHSLRLHAPFSGTAVAPHGTLELTSCQDNDQNEDCDKGDDRRHCNDDDWDHHNDDDCNHHGEDPYRGSFFGNNVIAHRHIVVTHLAPQ
jgi:hypothetical protein